MPNIRTAAGVPVSVNNYGTTVSPDSDPRTCSYTHFDLSSEQLGRTSRYNCWGFTFIPRRYWIDRPTDVDNIIRDNCDPVPDGLVQLGDIIRYRDDNDKTTHTGRVWQTDASGHAILIRSKWGPSAEYLHLPLDVPVIYGTNLAYFRQRLPLLGIADLWIKDSPGDTGEQYSGGPWWISPDILVDVPPYDGVPDINPVFDHPNHTWAVVRNRSDQSVDNVYVRYYWADPAAGLLPSNWNLIPGTPGHPNPAGPISIPGNSSTVAPYVEWIPTAAPAHQCLLAIAYINDNPRDINNPDPLVYPFEIPWDNNIAQRNVHVYKLENGSSAEFSIYIGIPFNDNKEIKGAINAVLTYSQRLTFMDYPTRIVPLGVTFALDKKQKFAINKWKEYLKMEGKFRPYDHCLHEKPLAGAVLRNISLVPKKPHKLEVNISAPKEAEVGSVYYLHIAQYASNMVTGGYTAIIMIV